jgi:hypothetical protein
MQHCFSIPLCALVLAGAILSAVGCSSTSNSAGDSPYDAPTLVSDSQDSASNDGAATLDSIARDTTPIDVGPLEASAPNPTFVTCGGFNCPVGLEFCCSTFNPAAQNCMNAGAACAGGDIRQCDEPGDCSTGYLCYVTNNTPLFTQCSPQGIGPVMCKVDSDCPTGTGPCVTQTCNTDIGRATVLSTCGGSVWCTQHP